MGAKRGQIICKINSAIEIFNFATVNTFLIPTSTQIECGEGYK